MMKLKKIRNFRKNLRKFERLVFLQQTHCCQAVTVAQCHLLLEIEELGKTTTQELADKLLLDKSTLSRTVDSLVKIGLLKRLDNPEDRRFTPLTLTAEGKVTCDSINQENDELYQKVFSRIKPKTYDEIISSFEQMVQLFLNEKRSTCSSGEIK